MQHEKNEEEKDVAFAQLYEVVLRTIEVTGLIPVELREGVGGTMFTVRQNKENLNHLNNQHEFFTQHNPRSLSGISWWRKEGDTCGGNIGLWRERDTQKSPVVMASTEKLIWNLMELMDVITRDTFNIPAYMRSTNEAEKAFEQCHGFEIQRLEYQRIVEHSKEKYEEWIRDPVSYGKAKANLVRATLNPIVEAHIGPKLSEELFKRFEMRASWDMVMLHKTCFKRVVL